MAPRKNIKTGDWKYRLEGLTTGLPQNRGGLRIFDRASSFYHLFSKVFMTDHSRQCPTAVKKALPETRNYRYSESGLSNVVLHGIEVADCPVCGNSNVIIPGMARIHRAMAQALANSPARLTGE